MSSEIKVDTISEKTPTSGVTIDSVLLKDGSVKGNGTGRKNYIINGNFDIWQRGTSVTTGYGPDRFTYQNSGSTGTLAQGSFTAGQTDVPNNPKYFANLTVTGADDNANIAHRIEDVYTLSGETATISFYAKHTTNAPTSFNVTSYQVFGSGGSTAVETSIATSQTTTTSWQKYTATVTFPSVSGKTIGASSYLELLFINPNNEIFDIQIAQIQLEKGSVATDFEVRPIGEELNLCARYYQKLISPRVNFDFDNAGLAGSASLISVNIPLINEMRIDSDGTTGTVTKSGDMAINDYASNGNNLSGTPINYFRISKTILQLGLNKATANMTSGSHYKLSAVNDAYFDIDVEL